VPAEALRGTADVCLRFEDVTQDGRLALEAIPNALGAAVWRTILGPDPAMRDLFARGIVPVLSRFVLEGKPGPLSANTAAHAEGACCLARSTDGRIVLDMWAELHALPGRTYDAALLRGDPRREAEEKILVGRVYGEHVLTRPFEPPAERRVRDLDFPGAPVLEQSRPALPPADEIARLPPGATPLEPAMSVDSQPTAFGIVHTDSNMHVNSLVYLRLFEEAALRRFLALGRRANVLGRTMEIVYRKPCFAGQTMRVVQRAFEADGRLGAAAVLLEEKDAATPEALNVARPHAYARMTFE
jgi:hypothetical protein